MEAAVIEKEAMKLSSVEKALLADRLLQALDIGREASIQAWTKVAQQRLQEFRAGSIDAYDGQTVIDSLRKELK